MLAAHTSRSTNPRASVGTVALVLPFVLWTASRLLAGERRWEHAAMLVLVPVLAFASRGSHRVFRGLVPIALLGLVYDAMRFVKDVGVTPTSVHVCDLRAADAALFGVRHGSTVATVHDFVRAHPSPVLDLWFAVPYGTYIFVSIAFAVYLYRRDYAAMQRFGWAFFLVNVVGFVVYHLYPAAPPWYFHAHGCVVDVATQASPGPSLVRVDQILGVPYFQGFYGRSNDVFGAMPSLHVAYPMLIVLYGVPRLPTTWRWLAIAFLVDMVCAAVYLDHHWILDVVIGLALSTACAWVVDLVDGRRLRLPVAS